MQNVFRVPVAGRKACRHACKNDKKGRGILCVVIIVVFDQLLVCEVLVTSLVDV